MTPLQRNPLLYARLNFGGATGWNRHLTAPMEASGGLVYELCLGQFRCKRAGYSSA